MKEADYYIIVMEYDDHCSPRCFVQYADTRKEAEETAEIHRRDGWTAEIHACIEGDEI
jgi:hypothetical protein